MPLCITGSNGLSVATGAALFVHATMSAGADWALLVEFNADECCAHI
jgi:hypothetical protein